MKTWQLIIDKYTTQGKINYTLCRKYTVLESLGRRTVCLHKYKLHSGGLDPM